MELFDSGQAVGLGELHVFRAIEVEDVVAKSWGVEAPVALERVARLKVKKAVVTLRAVVLFNRRQKIASGNVPVGKICLKTWQDEVDELHWC